MQLVLLFFKLIYYQISTGNVIDSLTYLTKKLFKIKNEDNDAQSVKGVNNSQKYINYFLIQSLNF